MVPIPKKGGLFYSAFVADIIFASSSNEGCAGVPEGISLYFSQRNSYQVPSLKGRFDMLKVHETKHPHTTILELSGSFDHQSTSGIETLIVGAQELGCKYIILDFSHVTGIDSIVLGHLFMWYHKMQPHHVKLSIANPPRVKHFGISNVLRMFPSYPSALSLPAY